VVSGQKIVVSEDKGAPGLFLFTDH
jgi:hypothetical protein